LCLSIKAFYAFANLSRLRGGVRIAQRVAEVARIEQSEIRDRAARPAPDFVSLIPGYACFCSILKRGVVGTFHKVSAKYMPLYVAEFQFRYNNRDNPDIFGTAIAGC
jgi:hypothetical protein